jgi:6-phosphogluconate dehydrogenase
MATQYDFGLVGLGVMGRNFILNVVDNDFSAIGLDTDPDKAKALEDEAKKGSVKGTTDVKIFVESLSAPRKIMMLVPAGKPVDSVIDSLLPYLDNGDLIIDGGNSFFEDTDRRIVSLKEKGIRFIGAGVSGGAKGARFGPSIMPGGDHTSYELIKPIFEACSAKAGQDNDPCVAYMGAGSAGNYVKMIHNGIEYGLMQLIAEVYDIMHRGMNMSNESLAATFDEWNQGVLQSFLIEITAEIFNKKDSDTDQHLVDVILDKAKQKGTGKWTSQNAMDLGVAVPSIDAAVSMRQLSALKELREKAEAIYSSSSSNGLSISAEDVKQTLLFAFIITYSQGLEQLKVASSEMNYGLDLAKICSIWRGGCIIRAGLLENMTDAFNNNPDLPSLIMDKEFSSMLKKAAPSVAKVLNFAIENQLPTLVLSACQNYFFAFKSGRLPLNLVQAQRDYFGSHTYERLDKDGIFHTEW